MEAGLGLHSRRRAPGAVVVAIAAVAVVVLAVGIGFASHALFAGGAPVARSKAGAVSRPLQVDGLKGIITWPAAARPAPPISGLRDQSGAAFSLASLRGRPVAVTFMDSLCKTDCPLSGRALASAERHLPAARRPALVVVSVNPKDDPANVHRALHEWGLAGVARVYWLLGSRAQLSKIWKEYDIAVKKTPADVTHTDALFLLGRNLDERSGYLWPYLPSKVTHDMGLLESGAAGA